MVKNAEDALASWETLDQLQDVADRYLTPEGAAEVRQARQKQAESTLQLLDDLEDPPSQDSDEGTPVGELREKLKKIVNGE